MAQAEVLNVTVRKSRGTSNARRERLSGKIPGVLYGHGGENVCLSISADDLNAALRHGGHFVEIQGEVKDSALIGDIQWDAFGVEVLHVDLTRVMKGESASVTVPIELRGAAPGVKAGGIVQQLLHEVEIECPVTSIPDKLEININSLQLHQSLKVSDLTLPEDAKALDEPDTVIVQCVEPLAVPEVEEGALPAGSVEPEVIGRKPEEGEEGGE